MTGDEADDKEQSWRRGVGRYRGIFCRYRRSSATFEEVIESVNNAEDEKEEVEVRRTSCKRKMTERAEAQQQQNCKS